MNLEIPKNKIYIEIDENKNVVKIFSDVFEQPTESSILLDEGHGDIFAHAHLYLEKPIQNMNGIAQYKYINGNIIEKSQEEIEKEIEALPVSMSSAIDENEMIFSRLLALENAVFNN